MSAFDRRMFRVVRMVLSVASEKTGGEIPSKAEAVRLAIILAFCKIVGEPLFDVSYFEEAGSQLYDAWKANSKELLSKHRKKFPLIFYSAVRFCCSSDCEDAFRWWFFETYGAISWTFNARQEVSLNLNIDKETASYCRKIGELAQKYVERDLNIIHDRPVI